MASSLQTLMDERDINAALTTYCRAIDRVDMELLKSVFADGARLEYSMFEGTIEEFCTLVPGFVAEMGLTQHQLSNVRILIAGDDAEVESYCTAHHSQVPGPGGVADYKVGLRYLDRFSKSSGEWRIAVRKVIYDWHQKLPAALSWDAPLFVRDMLMGQRGRKDPSYRD